MTFALGETATGELPLEIVLKNSVTKKGLSRIVSGHSYVKVAKVKGHSLDEIGRSIAQSRPIMREIRAQKMASGGRVTKPKGSTYEPNYWGRVKSEVFILLCTKDKKYAPLRRQLGAHAGKTQLAIVGAISAGVASSAGVVAGAAVPLVAICLIGFLQVGKNAFCQEFTHLKLE